MPLSEKLFYFVLDLVAFVSIPRKKIPTSFFATCTLSVTRIQSILWRSVLGKKTHARATVNTMLALQEGRALGTQAWKLGITWTRLPSTCPVG